ncbi:MAG: sensor histidine kinase, partial [Lachnospiraceae bacterium]|nr:sensor histidine kinase [Lachnospiraceae bacterium]
ASELQYDTGEIITDIILTARAQEMTGRGIELDADFRFPAGTGIDPYDIGIILNNALENAMEASRVGDLITLRAFLRGALFFIEVENPTVNENLPSGGKVAAKPADEGAAGHIALPPSTKPQDDLHGLGLRNILRCAKRYHGTLDIGQEEGLFRLTVMLAATRTGTL